MVVPLMRPRLLPAGVAWTLLAGAVGLRHSTRQADWRALPCRLAEAQSISVSEHDRLLVVAPHADDEAIGAGGLIAKTVAAGGQVRVVFMTNGDGHAYAAAGGIRPLPSPERFIALGLRRQEEALAAGVVLGLHHTDLVFLGYPDRGLERLWRGHWDLARPYTSRYTRVAQSPYPNSYRESAPYAANAVVADLIALLRDFAPTAIVGPHPNDAHPDHWASHCLLMVALAELAGAGVPAGEAPHYLYLVHRGRWPTPRGARPELDQAPPRSLLGLDTEWAVFHLDQGAVATKHEAIKSHHSQVAVMGRYLMSFTRRTELFGRLPPLPAHRFGEDAPPDWAAVPPVVRSPQRDTLPRRLEGAADIKSLYLAVRGEDLLIRVVVRGNLLADVTYRIGLAAFGGERSRGESVFELSLREGHTPRLKDAQGQVHVALVLATFRATAVEASLPLRALGRPARLLACAEAVVSLVTVDRTAWQTVILPVIPAEGCQR